MTCVNIFAMLQSLDVKTAVFLYNRHRIQPNYLPDSTVNVIGINMSGGTIAVQLHVDE